MNLEINVSDDLPSAVAALGAKIEGVEERLQKVEERQIELLQLASFGKGSLKTLLRMGAAITALTGLGLAIRHYFFS